MNTDPHVELHGASQHSLNITVPKVGRRSRGGWDPSCANPLSEQLPQICSASQMSTVCGSGSQAGKATFFPEGKLLQTWKLWEEAADQTIWHGKVSDQNSLNCTYKRDRNSINCIYKMNRSSEKKNRWVTYSKLFIQELQYFLCSLQILLRKCHSAMHLHLQMCADVQCSTLKQCTAAQLTRNTCAGDLAELT